MRIYCFLLLLFLPLIASAQNYIQSNYHYNLENGLETRNIRSTFKDSRGFMWIATDIGAYRFDGFKFYPYKRNIKHNVPLSVERISEDEKGNLWFCHFNYSESVSDFSILTPDSEVLIPIEEYIKDDLPFPIEDCFNNVPRFNAENGIWISSRKSREIYEYINGSFQKRGVVPSYEAKDELPAHHYFSVDKTSDGTNWMTYNGFLYFSNAANAFERYQQLPLPNLMLKIDSKDRFWLVHGDEIFTKASKDAPIVKPSFIDSLDLEKIEEFEVESINEQFIVANQGDIGKLLLIDHQCGHMTAIKNPMSNIATHITPSHVQIDEANAVWVSTYEGVFQIVFQKNPFQKHLRGKSTRGITQKRDGNIFVASYSGCYEIDAKSGKEKLIAKDLNHGQGIFIDSKNDYWMGGPVRDFFKIKSFQPFLTKRYEQDKEEGTVFNFFEQKNDPRLWMGTDFGLYVYDEKEKDFFEYSKLNGFSEINDGAIFNFETIDESNFFAATSKGLFQIDINKGITNHFCASNNNFPYDFITYVYRDKADDTFWFGTKLGGLIHWDYPNGNPMQVTTQDELTDNTIYAIYADKVNVDYLWLPSNNGLMHFNKKTGEVSNYKVKDGIVHDEFNFQSHYEAKDGTIYLGGIQGVTSFHPKDVVVSKNRPELNLVSLNYYENGEKQSIANLEPYSVEQPIVFKPTSKSVNITVALNDYTNANACKFFSKIEGTDNNWLPMDGNSLSINGLPSGKNLISIKAKNSKGIWAKNEINIPIKMLPPFYLRWWFVALMALLLFGLVKLFIQRRTYLLEKEKDNLEMEVARRTQKIQEDKTLIEQQAKELQQLDELKSRFFANVTHELRTPLTLILGPLKQLLKSDNLDSAKARKTLLSISQNGDQLKQLVEEILDLNRLDAKKIVLNKEPVRLRNVVEKWINNFNPEAENRGIQFKLDYSATTNLYLNLDVQKLERIVVNLLSNAFKYSESGDTIYFRVSEESKQMKIEVSDSGLGIHEADLPHIFERFYQTKLAETNLMGGLGIGLALSKELSELMNGELSVKSKIGEGSTFAFSFPKEVVEGIMLPDAPQSSDLVVIKKEPIDVVGNQRFKNILVVEDNLNMQSFVVELLDKFATVYTANNGKVALEFLGKENVTIDLIVSDVMMPEMDGFTFLKQIRQLKKWQFTPLVFLTARADILDKIKAFTIGVDDYLIKPFDSDELIARVKNLLEKSRYRQEIDLDQSKSPEAAVSPIKEKESTKGLELINEFEKTDSADLKWLKELELIVINNIEQPNFNVSQLAFKVHIGERQLGRKLKKLTGMTPGSYIKEVRLQKARHLLGNKTFSTISEVAFHVGFKTPEYFSKIFKARFGKLPTELLKNV